MTIKKESRCYQPSVLFIPGGLLLGLGLGFLYNNLVPGLFIGLGVGFILMALVRMLCK